MKYVGKEADIAGFTQKFSPMGKGFVAAIIRQQALVYDLRTKKRGKSIYFIVQIDKSKFRAFDEALKQDIPMDLRDYGTVLHSGYDEPSPELKIKLREKYGMYDE